MYFLYFYIPSLSMNLLNGWYWSFLSTVTLHPTHLATPHIHYCTLHRPHAVHVTVSVSLPSQIRVGSSHVISVHIILDDPAGNSYI